MAQLRRRATWLLALFAWYAAEAQAGPAWLSDQPPASGWSKHGRHSHGGMVERGRGGVFVKRLWLREGRDPSTAQYTKPNEGLAVGVFGIEGQSIEPHAFEIDNGGGITFEMPDEGFYNAYLFERRVEGGTLEASIVKAEVLKHSCGEGHDPELTASRMPPRGYPGVPLEIIRERLPREDFHTRIASGDNVAFRVHYEGIPVAGAEVSLTTEQGWTKRVTTDGDGRAAFQIIRDYYPAWSDFDKRHHEDFLVTAEYRTDVSGELHGKPFRRAHYVATLPGTFYPSELEYSSYLIGLIVTLIAAALALGGVFFYRLKQRRVVRERFDEKD